MAAGVLVGEQREAARNGMDSGPHADLPSHDPTAPVFLWFPQTLTAEKPCPRGLRLASRLRGCDVSSRIRGPSTQRTEDSALCNTTDAKSVLFTGRLITQSHPLMICVFYKWRVKSLIFQGYFPRKSLKGWLQVALCGFASSTCATRRPPGTPRCGPCAWRAEARDHKGTADSPLPAPLHGDARTAP